MLSSVSAPVSSSATKDLYSSFTLSSWPFVAAFSIFPSTAGTVEFDVRNREGLQVPDKCCAYLVH